MPINSRATVWLKNGLVKDDVLLDYDIIDDPKALDGEELALRSVGQARRFPRDVEHVAAARAVERRNRQAGRGDEHSVNEVDVVAP